MASVDQGLPGVRTDLPPARESPLHRYRGATIAGGGVAIVERPFRPMFNLRADASEAATRDALLAATGLAWPAANRFAAHDGRLLAWLGPDEFLLVGERGASEGESNAAQDDERQLRAMLGARVHMLTAAGAGHTTLVLTGAGALELLARGCALDLHPRAFRPGDCLSTMFAKTVVALLHRGDDADAVPRIEMIVRRSYADHVWRWLRTANDGRAGAAGSVGTIVKLS